MSPLTLCGADPRELREMARDWWLLPLAGRIFEERPGLEELQLAICDAGDGLVRGRLFPQGRTGMLGTGWVRTQDRASQLLFLAPADALDADRGFARAFAPFCPDEGWAVVARAYKLPRRHTWRGARPFRVQADWLGARLHPDDDTEADRRWRETRHQQVVDPDVAAVLSGLEALDRLDDVAAAMGRVYRQLRGRERGATDADRARALADLKAALE